MVGPRNISSGEGIPMSLQRLPGNKVVSFYGSNGSFGMLEWWSVHYLYPLPADLYLRFPVGRSLDKNMKIQLDSDSTMTGGVVPGIRVPLNDTVINQLYAEGIDVELKYAIGELNSMLGMAEKDQVASGEILEQNIPNPVGALATIGYHLKKPASVNLSVYDLCGKHVKTIEEGIRKAGRYTAIWNTTDIEPGLYFYRITAGKDSMTRKCIVLR